MQPNNEDLSPTQTIENPKIKGLEHRRGGKRPAKKKSSSNQLQKGIEDFLTTCLPSSSVLQDHGLSLDAVTSALPKRYTVYQPLLLLPTNALSTPAPWGTLYAALDGQQREALFASILKAFGSMGLTHMAINAPIALTDTQGKENRIRSPVGLVPLYGNFGPLVSGNGEEGQPAQSDLDSAFWVQTVQNNGIVQLWAPLYTMFSRGNITEKARILGHGESFEGLDKGSLGQRVDGISVVDMYAGIGYFVFSYIKRGVKRVWGFELNGWSVEGLRRGCAENGWGCKVIRVQNDGRLDQPIQELIVNLKDTDRVVIFHGDNRFAPDILDETKKIMEARKSWNDIRHVNLGLLPSSQPAWDSACRLVDRQRGGSIHVHENVAIKDIDGKKGEIVYKISTLRSVHGKLSSAGPAAECRHVEQVKTYAPGVMHCVFDIKVASYHES